jgi:hypothetical protein
MYIFVRGSDIAFPYIYIYILHMTRTNKFPIPPIVRNISLDSENISIDASLIDKHTIGSPLNFVPAAAVTANNA